MAGVKRRLEADDPVSVDKTHPPRKQKVHYTSENAQLAKIYNDLADDIQQLRLTAASELVKHATADPDDQPRRIDAALTRLIKGVCSSRKSARLGFSVALSEILRVTFASGTNPVQQVIQKIESLTQVQGNVSGQERRDAYLGRRWAYHAILQSGIFSGAALPATDIRAFVDAVAVLSAQRQWLRRECGAMLYEFLQSLGSQPASTGFAAAVAEVWQERQMWKSPEGVALWLAVSRIDGVKLPKHVWHKRNPLHTQERLILGKVMQEIPVDEDRSQVSGSRQIAPSFAWAVVIEELTTDQASEKSKDIKDRFEQFWTVVVSNGLFGLIASNERKYLGLQVVGIALATLPPQLCESALSAEVVRCIINHRAAEDRFLFEAAKTALTQIVATSKSRPAMSSYVVGALLKHGGITFDQVTKTKTIETLVTQALPEALYDISSKCGARLLKPSSANPDTERRLIADLLVHTIRSRKDAAAFSTTNSSDPMLLPWIKDILHNLALTAYKLDKPDVVGQLQPYPDEACRSTLQARVTSCLAHLLTVSSDVVLLAASEVLTTLQSLSAEVPGSNKQSRKTVRESIVKIGSPSWAKSQKPVAQRSLKLLLAMTVLQAYGGDKDAVSILEDVMLSVDSQETSTQSNIILIEILLGYISKPSTAYKKLAEQVFSSFAASMDRESLESLYEILARKESLSGQQELFDDHGESDASEGHDGSTMDVEDDSDVEIVNGMVTKALDSADEGSDIDEGSQDESESDSDTDSDSDDDAMDQGAEDEDEEAAFDRKLAEALGGAAFNEDADEDGSDMDDEQMLELEPHLAKVFKERKKHTSTKQDNKDARENIINFKSRVLDLLAIYAKAGYGEEAAFSMLLPLCELVRTTSSKMLSEKAFAVLKQYFDACNKHKVTPSFDDEEDAFALLTAVHDEALLDSAKLHTNACSRSSLFLAKVLVTADVAHYGRIAQLYAELQTKWYQDSKVLIQGSMFTEWTSWSIATRKH